jgi:hypothetical protein
VLLTIARTLQLDLDDIVPLGEQLAVEHSFEIMAMLQ